MSVGSAFGDNITITPSALGLSGTSYQSNSTGVNVSGVTVKFTNCNSTNGVGMKASTGCYWNSTETPQKIDSIVFSNVSYSSSSNAGFYVYGSTSEKGTTTKIYDGNNTGKIIVDFTSYNYKYFYVQNKNTRATYSGASIKIYYSQTIASYTVHFIDSLNHNFDSTAISNVSLPTPIIKDACSLNRWEFDSWRNRSGVKISGNSIALSSDTTLYALYRILDRDENIEVIDTLTNVIIGISGQNYKNFSDVTQTSDAVYSGRMAGGDNTSGDAIQLRTKDSNEGIISTTSGGLLKHIKVVWNSATTNDRALKIYTSDTVYHSPNDLYNYARCFDSISKGVTDLELNNKPYIGIRSKQSALYLNAIYITWLTKGDISYKYSYNPKCFSTDINVAEWFKDSVKFDVGNYDSIHTYRDDLENKSCDSIRIKLTRNDSSCIRWFHVPIFAEGSMSVEPECDVVVLGGKTFTPQDGDSSKGVYVYPGGTLIVNNTYTVDSLVLRRDNDDVPYFNYNGELNTDKLYFELRTDADDWRWLTLPDEFNTSLFKDYSEVLIKYYNGDIRAKNGRGGWQLAPQDTTFGPGSGFIFGIDLNSSEKRIYRIPLDKSILSQETSNKIGARVKDYRTATCPTNDIGWNVIGNPFMDIYKSSFESIKFGELVQDGLSNPWNGQWVIKDGTGSLRYAVIKSKSKTADVIAAGGYESVLLTEYSMKPFTSFFVQVKDEATLLFSKSNKIVRATIKSEPETFLRIIVNGTKTGCFISDEFTDEYEIGDDLESNYLTYQLINGYKLLYSAIPDSVIEHGITIYTTEGDIQLDSIVNTLDFEEINIFYDNKWFNLLAERNIHVKDSFILQARRKDICTDLESVKSIDISKFLYKGSVYIKRSQNIFNVLGEKIK